jgi:hypothetical protein
MHLDLDYCTSVDAEDLVIDDSREWEAVECLIALLRCIRGKDGMRR